MRVHSTQSATPHFPFLWPDPYRTAMKLALNLRYQLIPYHYSLAHSMYSTGALWMRPLIFDFRKREWETRGGERRQMHDKFFAISWRPEGGEHDQPVARWSSARCPCAHPRLQQGILSILFPFFLFFFFSNGCILECLFARRYLVHVQHLANHARPNHHSRSPFYISPCLFFLFLAHYPRRCCSSE